ncbi:MAG: EAL domain-containing protein [Sulfurospirillum sp.]|nr:EAL domain-containing protein [Sulfurospirillum sp.]
MIDTLTQIPNIKYLNERLTTAKYPNLFIIDIKDFKILNHTYGDNAGNSILTNLANSLEGFAHKYKMEHFRIENDSFALLLDQSFELSSMERIVANIGDFLQEQSCSFENETIKIQAHVGISFDHFYPLEKALKALEIAKKHDRAFMTYSEFANNLLHQSHEEIFQSIQKAVDEQKILPYYQPIVDKKNKILYEEVLMRIDGEKGIISPKIFLDIAKEKKVYFQVVQAFCKQLQTVQKPKGINLSFADFEDETLFAYLVETFAHTNTIFEIQNDASLKQVKNITKIKKIREHGIGICIDNVTCIEDLEEFAQGDIDFVKVHGNLVRLLHLVGIEYLTCKEILEACERLTCKVIATQINAQESFEASKEIGFKYFQGFLLAEPTR